MKQLILMILFSPSLMLFAQGGLIIEENAHFVIQGNPSLVIQDGRLVNDGNFVAANSTVIFRGTAPTTESTIGGASNTVFNNLTIAKSSNDVRLDYDIQVDGNIRMDGGLLILNYSDIILGGSIFGETGTNRITGNDGGAIIKTLNMNMPVNENPGNMGAEITSVANLGSTTIRRSHVQQKNGDDVSIYRYYDVIPETNTGLDATFRFHYFDEELGGLTEAELALWDYDGDNWILMGADDRDIPTNWVEVTGISSFKTLTLSDDMAGVLPIELLRFDAEVNQNQEVDLSWVTVAEINNDFFTIERSKDGLTFAAIEEVSGAGTTYQARQYNTTDKDPFAGLSYYRLKQTDFDGSFSYSDIKTVNIHRSQSYSVYPNPLREVLNVANDGTARGETNIEIYDAIGNLKYSNRMERSELVSSIEINEVADFVPGNYFLLIRTPTETYSFKLVKVRD
jgi:hypothetical protein